MRNSSFSSRGFRELDRALAKLERGPTVEQERAALRAGGQLIVEEARRLVPVDTGDLRDSIAVTDDRDARVYGKVNGADVSVFVGPVGSTEEGDVYYARFVEFGTRRHGAQPFMRPAIAAKRGDAERLVTSMLTDAVLKAIK
jgi:HK97 gp10 family phage protein